MRGIEVDKVDAWLRDNIDGLRGPFAYELIAGGHSNLTYRVTAADGRRVVLRRPPLGHVLESAHDMAREHKIISAVGRTGVPVPRTLGLCTDVEVNGAPFYVMDFVDGVVLDSQLKAQSLSPDVRRSLGFDLVDVLAELHAVDIDAVGLGDLAKRGGYV
ncbi:MAG: phosphotransferase family protein, partial [Acidimicrobiales bacterium]